MTHFISRFALRLGNGVLDWLARILSVLGVAGVTLWVTGMLWGTSVVLFSTGSMSPAIPQGSATISVMTPARLIRPGDVVTVPQGDGDPPITHRVVDASIADGTPGAISLTLKGDANPSQDPMPYVVTKVPKVLFVIPGGGTFLQFMSDPRMMAAVGIILVGLMVRAFGWERLQNVFRSQTVVEPLADTASSDEASEDAVDVLQGWLGAADRPGLDTHNSVSPGV